MAEQSVTLQPGEGKVVSFEATPHEARTYQVSVDGLTGSFNAVELAPPLPPPGTGLPTNTEIEAVKAHVHWKLEHLGFDPCAAVHFTEAQNLAVAEALQPIGALQERIQAEIERIMAEEAIAVEEYYALERYYDGILAEFGKLNIDYFREIIDRMYPNAYAVYMGVPSLKVYLTLEDYQRRQPVVSSYYELLTPSQKEFVDEWDATFIKSYLHRTGSFFSWTAYNGAKGAWAAAQDVGRTYQAQWKPLVRLKDGLEMRVWYCGYPLGY